MQEEINLITLIQTQLRAPKSQFNAFGKYNYRNCEDILEALKPLLEKYSAWIIVSDDIVEIGGRIYVKATATLSNGTYSYSATAFAREEESKKGMDASQLSGATSSYARKYALNGLLAIDDSKDSDATNKGQEQVKKPVFDKNNKNFQAAIDKINSGEGTLAQLEEKFAIDKVTRELILSKINV